MIPYYEELNDEEKNAVTKVIRTLLKQTFVLERKRNSRKNRQKPLLTTNIITTFAPIFRTERI